MTAGSREAAIQGDQRRRQGFREREVGGIVGGDGLTKLPDAWQQNVVGVACQIQSAEVVERPTASGFVDGTRPQVATQHLCHFQIQEVGRMKRLAL